MTTPLAPTTNGTTESTMAAVQRVVDRFTHDLGDHATTQAVFGPATTVGGRTIIPVAQVRYGLAAGGGSGAESADAPSGMAGGTLGGMTARPIAVIELTAEKVRVVPIPDIQTIITRVFTFAAVAMVAGIMLGRRAQGKHGLMRIGNIGRLGSPDIRVGPPGTLGGLLARAIRR